MQWWYAHADERCGRPEHSPTTLKSFESRGNTKPPHRKAIAFFSRSITNEPRHDVRSASLVTTRSPHLATHPRIRSKRSRHYPHAVVVVGKKPRHSLDPSIALPYTPPTQSTR